MTKLLFLDVDGVLNHANVDASDMGAYFARSCYQELSRICDETDCKIVLSSVWRRDKDLLQLLEHRFKEFDIPLIGKTPFIKNKYEKIKGLERTFEILSYLDRFQTAHLVEKFVVIDDDPIALPESHYVQTSYGDGGLTKEKADEVIQKLHM